MVSFSLKNVYQYVSYYYRYSNDYDLYYLLIVNIGFHPLMPMLSLQRFILFIIIY